MVAPERQRQGLGEVLFRTWDRHVGALARPRPVRVVSSAVPEAALAGRRARALPGQAADAPRAAASELAAAAQPARLRSDAADREDRGAHASAERRGSADPAVRRQLHRALGELAPKFDLAVRRDAGVSELEIRGCAARPLLARGAAARRPQRRLRRLPAPARAARPRDAARRLPRRPGRRGGARHAAALGRSRGAAGRLGQDPHVRDARRVPRSCGAPATSR